MYKIVGLKEVNYVSKTGRQVNGVDIHTLCEDKHVEGYAVEHFYISRSVLDECGIEDLSIEDQIEVFYNKYGKIASLKKVGE